MDGDRVRVRVGRGGYKRGVCEWRWVGEDGV